MAGKLEHGFVAVHCGAGHHPLETRSRTLLACKNACKKAYDVLGDSGASAIDACVAATMVLEDDPITNAGFGSNVTLDERVECDAGLMEGCGMRFAGVGCVPNVKNPISICKKMLALQTGANGDQLVPPMLLSGDGAVNFARKCNLEIVTDNDLVTSKSLSAYRKALKFVAAKNRKSEGVMDTVGVVVVDKNGNVAASCSSGGPLLKMPGRIGHSAQFGCGVWAQQNEGSTSNPDCSSVAISCTGCGEYLIRTSLARTIAQRLLTPTDQQFAGAQVLEETLRHDFTQSIMLEGMDEQRKIAGAIAIKAERTSNGQLFVDFSYGHCSSSMCLAYTVAGTKRNISKPKIRCVTSECPRSSGVVVSGQLISVGQQGV